ncbi:uncharacterized protein E0L32_009035 [Thyridium curvatum]|uniref:Uncharacterized protein n=1 Tax=Thyridium curvatum TaxID=1093900 RepID=A0A507ASN2_9PEZI|nr:uncharacterized protein E0L32_009035 [Thyridium curvatum]TPX09696.1 hypothetical protein E0L32_009035 [Thyridium curvatum]
MQLPRELRELLGTRRFWTDFFWITEAEDDAYSELEDTVCIDLPISLGSEGSFLSLEFSNDLGFFELQLKNGVHSQQLGWDDGAHWHPHVLRWDELDLVCRAVARLNPDLPHPGLPLLLLHRFAPICGRRGGDDDDAPFASALLDAAWRSLGIFSDREVQRLIERSDARDAGFIWRQNGTQGVWFLDQEEITDGCENSSQRALYTLRSQPSEPSDDLDCEDDEGHEEHSEYGESEKSCNSFPHHQLGSMLDRAQQTVLRSANGDLTQDGVLPSERPSAPHYTLRPQHTLDLRVPVQEGSRPLGKEVPARVTAPLNRILSDLDLGWAQWTGSRARRQEDGTFVDVDNSLAVHVHGNRDHGVQSSRRSKLAGSSWPSRFFCSDTRATFPAYDFSHAKPGVSQAQKFQMQLPAACLEAIRADPEATIKDFGDDGWLTVTPRGEPDANLQNLERSNWLVITASDGGKMGVCFAPTEEDASLASGSLRVEELSPGLAGIIYRLLSTQHLALFPPGLVAHMHPSLPLMETKTQVLSSDTTLYQILVNGAYAWWSRPVDNEFKVVGTNMTDISKAPGPGILGL